MKNILFLLMSIMIVVSLLGCEQQAEESIKEKIQISFQMKNMSVIRHLS